MYNNRNKLVRERMAEAGLDALLVSSLPNIYYLTGYTGSTAKLVITAKHMWFLTDFRYHEQFTQQCFDGYELVDNTGKKLVEDVLPGLISDQGGTQLGFESAHIPHIEYAKLNKAESWEAVPTESWVEDLRIVKDEGEIELIQEAVLLGERIFTELMGVINGDTTEADLAAEIHYRALKYGAQGYSFDPIVASGVNGAKPHAGFTTRKLQPGLPLTIDMGVALNGYMSDMTRTVFIKDCPPQWEAIYGIVREAKDRAFTAVKPGLLGKDIDAVARDYIYSAGYEGKFGHGLGHGVGIEVHEQPSLSVLGEKELRPGMVITNEPGIYLPGEGGVRIEDVFVVRDNGAEYLNTLDTAVLVVG
jgi:Xaa-Pro aminopeptidase